MKVVPRFGYLELRKAAYTEKNQWGNSSLIISTGQEQEWGKFLKPGDVYVNAPEIKTTLQGAKALKSLVKKLETEIDQAYVTYRASLGNQRISVQDFQDTFQSKVVPIAQKHLPAILDELTKVSKQKFRSNELKSALMDGIMPAYQQSLSKIVPGELGGLEEKDWTLPDLGIYSEKLGTTLWQRPLTDAAVAQYTKKD